MLHLLLNLFLGAPTSSPPVPCRRELYVKRFLAVARFIAGRRFARIDLGGVARTRGLTGPVVLYANHPDFWDPVVCGLISQAVFPNYKVYAPIDQSALRTHWYFRGLGFFGLKKGSLQGLRTLGRVGSAVLDSSPNHCLIITPEGRFTDPAIRPIRFQRGLAFLLANGNTSKVTAIPLALGYRNDRRAGRVAWAQLGSPLTVSGETCRKSLQAELETRLEIAMDENAERATHGSTGVDVLEATL